MYHMSSAKLRELLFSKFLIFKNRDSLPRNSFPLCCTNVLHLWTGLSWWQFVTNGKHPKLSLFYNTDYLFAFDFGLSCFSLRNLKSLAELYQARKMNHHLSTKWEFLPQTKLWPNQNIGIFAQGWKRSRRLVEKLFHVNRLVLQVQTISGWKGSVHNAAVLCNLSLHLMLLKSSKYICSFLCKCIGLQFRNLSTNGNETESGLMLILICHFYEIWLFQIIVL